MVLTCVFQFIYQKKRSMCTCIASLYTGREGACTLRMCVQYRTRSLACFTDSIYIIHGYYMSERLCCKPSLCAPSLSLTHTQRRRSSRVGEIKALQPLDPHSEVSNDHKPLKRGVCVCACVRACDKMNKGLAYVTFLALDTRI